MAKSASGIIKANSGKEFGLMMERPGFGALVFLKDAGAREMENRCCDFPILEAETSERKTITRPEGELTRGCLIQISSSNLIFLERTSSIKRFSAYPRVTVLNGTFVLKLFHSS